MNLQERVNLNVNSSTIEHLEKETESFRRIIQGTAFENTKEITHIKKGIHYPIEIRNLVKENRKVRRRWQQTKDSSNITIFNNKTETLKREIQKLKEENIQTYLENLSAGEETDYFLWNATRQLRRPIASILPFRKDQGEWARKNN